MLLFLFPQAERARAQLMEAREALARLQEELRCCCREAQESRKAQKEEAQARATLERSNTELRAALCTAEHHRAR